MTEMWPEQREQLPPEDRFEKADLSVRGLLWTAAGIVLLVLAALIGSDLLTPPQADVASTRQPVDPERVDEPPDPRITQSHRIQRRQLEHQVEERLNTYGWIDRDQGVARIPAERAAELLLERGFPSRLSADDARENVPPAGIAPAEEPGANPPTDGPPE